jgi:Carboxypeptidase regulatory-like domain
MKRLTSYGLWARAGRNFVLFCGMGAAAAVAVQAPMLLAQDQTQRVVQGKVVDKDNAGLKGATVYLKDGHTLAVKSYVASDDGSYRFGQLTSSADYQLWAEVDGKKSGVKNISSFDTRALFNITLKIDK